MASMLIGWCDMVKGVKSLFAPLAGFVCVRGSRSRSRDGRSCRLRGARAGISRFGDDADGGV